MASIQGIFSIPHALQEKEKENFNIVLYKKNCVTYG